MGVTVQYRGQLKSPDLIGTFCRELKEIANLMEWEYTILDEDFGKPTDIKLETTEKGCEIVGHLALKGINLNIHKDCGDLSFFFDLNGILRDPIQMAGGEGVEDETLPFTFVKTQYAPPEIHITLVKLFRYLKRKYFQTFEVMDEGDYWETGDENLLKEKMQFLSQKLDAFCQAVDNSWIKLEPEDSTLDLIVKIEKILREMD